MSDLETIRRSKHFRKSWTEKLEGLETPPQKLVVREGQGLNLLLFSSEDRFIHICVSPASDPRGYSTKTSVASLRQVGDFALLPQERIWLNIMSNHLRTYDMEEGWADYLDWTMEKPGISVGWRSTDRRTTSGHEVVIRLIENCNAACDFCGCIGMSYDYATRLEEVRERLRAEKEKGANRVVYTGGEPTLVPNLPELVSLAKEEGYEWVNLQTNGVRLADADLTDRLAAAGLDSILLSLHSHEPEVHNRILKLEDAFSGALNGIANAVRAGVKVGLNFVINQDNLKTLPGYMEFVHSHFASVGLPMESQPIAVTMSYVSPVGWALEHLDQIPRLSDAAPVMAEALSRAEKLGLDVHVPGLCGVPMCVLPGYEAFFDELRDENPPRLDTRTHVEACESCEHRSRCSGYWKVYMEQYGEGEFGVYDDSVAWARPPSPEETPALVAEVQGSLSRLLGMEDGSLPESVYRVPHHELACRLNEEGITTAAGGFWTDSKVELFSARHGLQRTLVESIGWIVDGRVYEDQVIYWVRTSDDELVTLKERYIPEILVGGEETVLRSLGAELETHPQAESVHYIPRSELNESSSGWLLQVRPRDLNARRGLVRKIKKLASEATILFEDLPLFVSHLLRRNRMDLSRAVTCCHGEGGKLLTLKADNENEGQPGYRVLSLEIAWDKDGEFEGIKLENQGIGEEGEDEKSRLEHAIAFIRAQDPDVMVVEGGEEILLEMMARAKARDIALPPGREPVSSRPLRSLDAWMQGRVVVSREDWCGMDTLLERCQRHGVVPRIALGQNIDDVVRQAGELL